MTAELIDVIGYQTTEPGTKNPGDRYLLKATVVDGSTGWAPENTDKVVEWNGSAWIVKLTPADDDIVLVDDEAQQYTYGSSAWNAAAETNLLRLGYAVEVTQSVIVTDSFTTIILNSDIDTTSGSLIFEGPLIAPHRTIFKGNPGAAKVLPGNTTPILAAWWGVHPSADETSNAYNLNDCISSLEAGSVVKFGAGTYKLSPTTINSFTDKGIVLPNSDITILGAGRTQTVLEMQTDTPTNYAVNIFVAKDKSGITIRDMHLKGNNETSTSDGCGVVLKHTTGNDIADFEISSCTFEDFGGPAAINIDGNVSGKRMLRLRVLDNDFSGGAVQSATSGHAACILLDGHDTTGDETRGIAQVEIRSNHCACGSIKSGIVAMRGIRDLTATANTILDCGTNVTSVTEAYAVRLETYADRAVVTGNIIKDPEDAGVYAKSSTDTVVKGNVITGQVDTGSGVLGGIALDLVDRFVVSDNDIENCHYGIQIKSALGGSCSGNVVNIKTSSTAAAITVRYLSGDESHDITLAGNTLVHPGSGASGDGIYLTRPSGSSTDHVVGLCIVDNVLSNFDAGVRVQAYSGSSDTQLYKYCRISSNIIRAAGSGTASSFGITADLGLAYSDVCDNLVVGDFDDSAGVGIQLINCVDLNIQGNAVHTIANETFAYDFADTTGTLWGNQTYDTSNVIKSDSTVLGEDTPGTSGWYTTAEDGTVVQRLAPGSGDSKIGWVRKGGSWKTWGAIDA